MSDAAQPPQGAPRPVRSSPASTKPVSAGPAAPSAVAPLPSLLASLIGVLFAATAVAAPVPAPGTTSAVAAKATARPAPAKQSRAAAPKGPVAAKNIAVGAAAVPALPKAFLADGCLDATHGE
ncbi:MAG: hypothetical protein JNL85_06615, partial [Rubrivivax sp.]|nr:hypothetical protein [Rubrivivax sp.]